MRAEKVLTDLLEADAGVAAIVGTKIYGNVPPENTAAPLIVYRKLAAVRNLSLSMSALAEVEARIEVLCIATTYAQLKALAEAVRVALAYKRGTYAGVDVLNITVDDESADEYDADLREHAQSWVYLIKHTE